MLGYLGLKHMAEILLGWRIVVAGWGFLLNFWKI